MSESPFRGLYTCIYRVPDVAAAKAWYANVFGVEPYFDEPFYVGFEVGGYELGLLQDVGGGIRVATVRDPWGNPIGIIENPHFGKAHP